MVYPNAYEGVKKLFVSEMLHLIATVFGFAASLLFVFASKMSESNAAPLLIVEGILMLASVIIIIISLILKIAGLAKAKRNESLFKTALGFAVAGIVFTAIYLFTSGMFANICSGINETFTLLVNIYMVLGVYSLALKLDDNNVIRAGKVATIGVAVIFAFAVLDRVVGIFVPRLDGTMDIICSVLEVIGSAVLLTYLALAKKMLAKGTTE